MSNQAPYKDRDNFAAFTTERAHALHAHILSLPNPSRFAADPSALIAEIEAFANAHRVPMLFRASKAQLALGVLAAMDPKPRIVVEFGTYVGCSALAWGHALQKFGGGGHVFTSEVDPAMAAIARDFVRLAGLEDVVEVLVGPGAESLERLVAEGRVKQGGADVVFFDHWEQLYVPDLKVCERLKVFRKGSVVMADNTDFPGAPDYLEYIKKGGSGEPGAVRFESKSLEAEYTGPNGKGPKIVEVTTVVEA